ncbi:MAG: NUDIX hydrolase [Gammaproteobacteria bacterium]|nr:NUDIX hydrolase [Gammaproteobacteria bacterium]
MNDNLIRHKITQHYCTHCGSKVSIRIPEGDNRERAICDACGAIFYENPKIVSGCLLTYKDKILLCKRATEPRCGYWTLPAGFLENNETLEEGALRETFEEAGAKSQDIKLFLICNLPHISQIYIMYHGSLLDGKFSAGVEMEDIKLVTETEIPWDDLAFPVISQTLKCYLEDRKKGNIDIHFHTIMKK